MGFFAKEISKNLTRTRIYKAMKNTEVLTPQRKTTAEDAFFTALQENDFFVCDALKLTPRRQNFK